jgi:hypothetical protein
LKSCACAGGCSSCQARAHCYVSRYDALIVRVPTFVRVDSTGPITGTSGMQVDFNDAMRCLVKPPPGTTTTRPLAAARLDSSYVPGRGPQRYTRMQAGLQPRPTDDCLRSLKGECTRPGGKEKEIQDADAQERRCPNPIDISGQPQRQIHIQDDARTSWNAGSGRLKSQVIRLDTVVSREQRVCLVSYRHSSRDVPQQTPLPLPASAGPGLVSPWQPQSSVSVSLPESTAVSVSDWYM